MDMEGPWTWWRADYKFDERNIHMLKYGEVILTYTQFSLKCMLPRTACYVDCQTYIEEEDVF